MVLGKSGRAELNWKSGDGLMVHSEDPVNCDVDTASKAGYVLLRQIVLDIKMKIMLPRTQLIRLAP